MQSDHTVFDSYSMYKRLFIIQEVGVRYPELVCHSIVQSQVQGYYIVGQPLISPGLLKIHGQGIVLWMREEIQLLCIITDLWTVLIYSTYFLEAPTI